jgi:hypothetical protein
MTDRTLKISFGLLSLILFAALILKLKEIPGGMMLPGYFLGGMALFGILLGCVVITSLLKLIFKKKSYLTLYAISTIIPFSVFYYYLYSPILKIIVPRDYKGSVTLVLSNVKENILMLDSNGIGYITQWTFNHTYTKPQVTDTKGTSIDNLCVGYNPSAFWGRANTCCVVGKQIESLDFEIVPKEKNGQKQYYSKDLTTLVNKSLVLFTNSNH